MDRAEIGYSFSAYASEYGKRVIYIYTWALRRQHGCQKVGLDAVSSH